jgi:hypothetical protein
MMTNIHRFGRFLAVLSVAIALHPSSLAAEESGGFCPERIETQQSLRAPVAGYEASSEELRYWWDAVTFYDGRPEQMASLKYDTEVEAADGGSVLTWNFDLQSEYWIRCQYSSTSVSLVKKLPPVSQCVVTFSRDQEIQVSCR